VTAKKVLIVCHGYPPNSGVGGRRWAKLSKFMHASGLDVTVIHVKPGENAKSPWNEDVKGIKTICYSRKYPGVIEGSVKKLYQKIAYRIFIFILKIITKSNYFDRAVLLENEVKSLILKTTRQHGINNLIVTGAPFSLLYYAALIKQENPHLNFIADIRDSWLDDNYYGFGIITKKRQKEEERRLRLVLQMADNIIVPYPFMQKMYSNMIGNKNILLQPHGFDDTLVQVSVKERSNVNLVNFGSQYHDMENVMELVSNSIEASGCRLNFYTSDEKYKKIFSKGNKLNQQVFFHKIVPEKEVFKILSESTAAILFTNEAIKDFIATKYIETVASRTPIVVIGVEGDASRFVVENRLGVFIPENKILEMIPNIRQILNDLQYDKDFDVSRYSMKKQAEEIIRLLQ
jgi:glycosyltransferase involved in cell wall biosynthesis